MTEKSKLVAVRLPAPVVKVMRAQAQKLGYVKPDGEPNVSEYIRNLIINDRR